jgi:ABC-type tungstate transport system permease subunit
MLKQIIEQYKIVFNEDGTVKNCGREECKKLIEILNKTFSDKIFGNEKTGFMNIANIHEAINSIIKKPSDKLLNQYSVVFNEDRTVKNCGREECKKLIEMMNKEYPNINFGNLKTGFMNTENIILIIKK